MNISDGPFALIEHCSLEVL